MRSLWIPIAATAALAGSACSKSTAANPSTSNRDELNPPAGLITVTGDKKLQLRWSAANAEGDFKGYHVFVYKGTVASLKSSAAYPSGADLTKGAQIPRCASNNAVFAKFGFQTTTSDCEGAAEKTSTTSSTSTTSKALVDATASGAGGAASDTEKLSNISACAENTTDPTLSLAPATIPTLTQQTCTITKDNTGTALVNGTTYTVFIAAVMGDNKNKLSWTSNFVQDTPAPVLYDSTLQVAAGKYYVFAGTNLTSSPPTAYSADPAATACTDAYCTVLNTNSATTPGIYIGRVGATTDSGSGNSYQQRAFLSVPAGSAVAIQLRGPQVWDNGTFAKSIPGDKALDKATVTYDTKGTLYPIYGGQVFDLQVTSGSNTYYGKIVVGTVALATANDPTSNLKIPLTIVMQPAAGVTDYLTAPEDDSAAHL